MQYTSIAVPKKTINVLLSKIYLTGAYTPYTSFIHLSTSVPQSTASTDTYVRHIRQVCENVEFVSCHVTGVDKNKSV